MKLTPAAEFAVRGLVVLAQEQGQDPLALKTICERRDLPKEYLAKIFGSLARANIVTPVRGKHGGYVLARERDQITMLEIIEAVEGPVCLNFCQQNPPKCKEFDCPMRPVWTELQETMCDKLSSVTLADCLVPRRRRARK